MADADCKNDFWKKMSSGVLPQIIAGCITLFLLIWLSQEVIRWLASVFTEPREDMEHGWLVPFFSLALLFLKRKEIAKCVGRPSLIGFLLFVPGLIIFWIGIRGDQIRISQIASIWLLWTSFYACFGKKFALAVLFPVAFLLFTVPLSFLDVYTVKLRILTAYMASGLLNGLGIPVVRTGTGLYCMAGDGFSLDIADPCSGLRSIFALTALTAAYGYFAQKTLLKKWLLFICCVPIAIIGNLARIFSIAVVAFCCGQEVATGFYHDYSGFVVFIIGVLVMMWASALIAKAGKERKSGSNVSSTPSSKPIELEPSMLQTVALLPPLTVCGLAIILLVPCLVFSTGHLLSNMPPPQEESPDFLVSALPDLPGYRRFYPWFCQNDQCQEVVESSDGETPPEVCPKCGKGEMKRISIGEGTALPEDTGFRKCDYYDDFGAGYQITVVINGKSRQSIHRPEICLPAQGFAMENGRIEKFDIGGGHTLDMHCVELRRQNSTSKFRMGQGYFFVSPEYDVADHWSRQLIGIFDRAFKDRITRWAMVTVFCEESFTSTPERKKEVERFLSAFYRGLFTRSRFEDEERSGAK